MLASVAWRLAIAAVLVGGAVSVGMGDTLLVPSPYATIQAAIDAAVAGDEVVIADGTYTGVGNKDLDFHGKAITVRSASGNPDTCIIDCEGSGRGFYFHSAETADAVVTGLTIRGGHPTIATPGGEVGGAVCCKLSSSPTLAFCKIRANSATYGGGLYCQYSLAAIIGCEIRDNSSSTAGGGIYCAGNPKIIHSTIIRNSAPVGGGVYCQFGSAPALTNCILWGDTPQEIYVTAGSVSATYCDIEGGWGGLGNIDANPGFPFADDYHLMSGSPCVDSGTNDPPGGLPTNDLDGNLRLLDGTGDGIVQADIGAYEFNVARPSIAASATALEIIATEQDDDPPNQVLSLRNCGGGTLIWEISGQPGWLTTAPSAGSAGEEPVEVVLSAQIGGLAAGVYVAELHIRDPQAVNTPRSVAVTLDVKPVLHVPSEFATIQAAIDAAVDLATVEIADGIYTGMGNKDLDFHGKRITVRSANGDPNTCVIDCEGSGRGFRFARGETAAAVVSGLTIANGFDTRTGGGLGGGLYCSGSSPTVIDCTIRDCVADNGKGGGVYCASGNPSFVRCTILGNSADAGGGAYIAAGNPAFTECRLAENIADKAAYAGYGGGAYCNGGAPTFTACTVSTNTADYGAGLCCYAGTLTGCRITANSASQSGGGILSYGGAVTNCVIEDNAAYDGGGITYDHDATITNCTIIGNRADGSGGGVHAESSRCKLTNCIVWANQHDQIHGAPTVSYCDVEGGWTWTGTANIDADPHFAFTHDAHLLPGSPCIDAGTNAPIGGLPAEDFDGAVRNLDGNEDQQASVDMGAYEFDAAAPRIALDAKTIEFFAVQGWPAPPGQAVGVRNSGGSILEWEVAGLPTWLSAEPAYGSSSGEIDTLVIAADIGDLTLGRYESVLSIAAANVINSPRSLAVRLYVGRALHVPSDYATIQSAVDAAGAGDVVLIADGVYTGAGNKDVEFRGRLITVRSASGDPNTCVIDCQGTGRGFVFHASEGRNSVLSGLTITNGAPANGWADGGAIYCSGSAPTIVNCIISDCQAYNGGGIAGYSADPAIVNCIIHGNLAEGCSGGIDCFYGTPEILDCTIRQNDARAGSGGGIGLYSCALAVISNCTVVSNRANSAGGGISSGSYKTSIASCQINGNYSGYVGGGLGTSDEATSIVYSTLSGNVADEDGGGAFISGVATTLSNCVVSGNVAHDDGGGVFLEYPDGRTSVVHCTLTGNSADHGDGLYCSSAELIIANSILWANMNEQISSPWGLVVTHCDVQGGWNGTANSNQDPLFVRHPSAGADGWGDDPNTPDVDEGANDDYGDLRLRAGSPCIDAGDNAAVPVDGLDLDGDGDIEEPGPFDLAGGPRFVDDPATADCQWAPGTCGEAPIVDMGAHEFVPACRGDTNCDGRIDFFDINPFVAALLQHVYCDGSGANADVNEDGAVDFFDINAFAALLTENALPIGCGEE